MQGSSVQTVAEVTLVLSVPLRADLSLPTDQVESARRRLHKKAACSLALFCVSYFLLVFVPLSFPVALVAGIGLVHAVVAVATGIMHGANHGTFSSSARANAAWAFSADMLGASSFLWRRQHNLYHHQSTNVVGVDSDIDQEPFLRIAKEQPWHPWHRAQAWYCWPIYGFLIVRWVLFADIVSYAEAKRDHTDIRTRDIVGIFAGKAAHLLWAVALPPMFHSWTIVLGTYLAISWASGLMLAMLFQLAHAVEGAEFMTEKEAAAAGATGQTRTDEFIAHQLRATLDIDHPTRFGRAYSRFIAGGLDHQVEHHLCPHLPHTSYETLTEKVDAMCLRGGLERRSHRSFVSALGAHRRHLSKMGRSPD